MVRSVSSMTLDMAKPITILAMLYAACSSRFWLVKSLGLTTDANHMV